MRNELLTVPKDLVPEVLRVILAGLECEPVSEPAQDLLMRWCVRQEVEMRELAAAE